MIVGCGSGSGERRFAAKPEFVDLFGRVGRAVVGVGAAIAGEIGLAEQVNMAIVETDDGFATMKVEVDLAARRIIWLGEIVVSIAAYRGLGVEQKFVRGGYLTCVFGTLFPRICAGILGNEGADPVVVGDGAPTEVAAARELSTRLLEGFRVGEDPDCFSKGVARRLATRISIARSPTWPDSSSPPCSGSLRAPAGSAT